MWEGDYDAPLSLNHRNYVQAKPANFPDPSGRRTSGIGNDKIWAGLNNDYSGWHLIAEGLNEDGQECQQNWNKGEAAWQRGDDGRAIAWRSGFTSAVVRAAEWVNDNNRDWDIPPQSRR